jgi:hypothetical protein
VIAEILIENSRGVFGGQVWQDNIYMGAHVYGFNEVVSVFFIFILFYIPDRDIQYVQLS